MSNWVETEMGACQLHDARHAKRLAHLFGRRSEKLVPRIPSACHGWAETVAAYRCLDHPALASRRFSQDINTPRWSGFGRRMWSCWGKTRRFWMTVQLGLRRGWGP
jgi:hypothetical protein